MTHKPPGRPRLVTQRRMTGFMTAMPSTIVFFGSGGVSGRSCSSERGVPGSAADGVTAAGGVASAEAVGGAAALAGGASSGAAEVDGAAVVAIGAGLADGALVAQAVNSGRTATNTRMARP
jgi:hypothetical protein